MKQVIKTCLNKYNNKSYTNAELSDLIIEAIKTNKWYLDLNDKNKKWIYESPDGGETVFRRPFADYDPSKKEELKDTAGYPIKKISKYLTTDIDEIVMIDNDVCSHGNNLNSTCSECDEEQARESWVCNICGESTYDVEYDYVGSGTNHLDCELKENSDDDIEYREKSWLEKKLQYKIFKLNKKYELDDIDYYMGPDGHYKRYPDDDS